MHANFPNDVVATRAYENWQQRGCPHGSDQEDWSRACADLERELIETEARARFHERCREMERTIERQRPVAVTRHPAERSGRERRSASTRIDAG